MKVAHLTTVDLSLRFLVFPQLLAVVESGGEAVGISAPGPWVSDLEAGGVRHCPLPSSTRGVAPVGDVKAAYQLWRILRRERPDVLHTHNPKPGVYGRLLGRLAGVPVVVNTVHGLYATPDDRLAKRAAVYLIEALAARFSDAELVQSAEDLATIRRLRIAPSGRAGFLGNGIELTRFDPHRPDLPAPGAVRRELGVADDRIVVGMVGRLVAEKGFPEFFAAMEMLDERFVALAIGPEDPEKADALPPVMLQRARDRGVKLLGMRTDLDRLYRAMDLLVLPSHREGFPRAAMEAAAMGLPIVATDIRGCREVVDQGENGVLVAVGDVDSLALAIRRIGDDPSLRRAMGEAARAKALAEFDERRVVQTVLAAYRRVANAKGLTAIGRALGAGRGEARIRKASPDDAAVLARLHVDSIDRGFLPRLGERFMRVLYRALIGWNGGVVLVADAGDGPVGFVAGAVDTRAFFRRFAVRHGLAAAVAAMPALLRPTNLRRALETARHGEGDHPAAAELMSMAVTAERRNQGLGRRLGDRFLGEMSDRGASSVMVVAGSENRGAISFYRSLGFSDAGTTEVHAGEQSQVLVWSA